MRTTIKFITILLGVGAAITGAILAVMFWPIVLGAIAAPAVAKMVSEEFS